MIAAALLIVFTAFKVLFGSIGVTAVFMWPRLTSYLRAVVVQCAGASAFAIYFAISGSATASASCLIGLGQLLAAALIRDRRVVMLLYVASLACLALIVTLTWSGVPTVLASCGCLLGTIARMQATTNRMKLWFLIGAPFWLAHNLLTWSIFGLVVDGVSISSNGISVVRLRSLTNGGPRPCADAGCG